MPKFDKKIKKKTFFSSKVNKMAGSLYTKKRTWVLLDFNKKRNREKERKFTRKRKKAVKYN